MRRCILWMMGVAGLLLASCQKQMTQDVLGEKQGQSMLEVITSALDLSFHRKELTSEDITVSKSLLFDRYTLDDVYPYGDTVRSFKWDASSQMPGFCSTYRLRKKTGVFFKIIRTGTEKLLWYVSIYVMLIVGWRIPWG